jgi:hypothetical protein
MFVGFLFVLKNSVCLLLESGCCYQTFSFRVGECSLQPSVFVFVFFFLQNKISCVFSFLCFSFDKSYLLG